MDSKVSLCLPVILSNREDYKKGGVNERKNNINNTNMTILVLVSNSTQTEHKKSSPSNKFKNLIIQPSGGISSVGSDTNVSHSNMAGFEQ